MVKPTSTQRSAAGRRAQRSCRHRLGRALLIEKYRLPNGLKIIFAEDPYAPTLSLHSWFAVGSRHERPGKSGLAHLFEHLMFKESAHLAEGEFDDRMERLGGQVNAATWLDFTFYHEDLPAAHLEEALALEAERLAHLTIQERQLATELAVVQNERQYRVSDSVEGELLELVMQLAFRRHPYRNPVIGWEKDLRRLRLPDCRQFFRTYYAVNNLTLVLAGAFDSAAALTWIERFYGAMPAVPRPKLSLPRESWPKPRRRILRRAVAADRFFLAYPAPPLLHRDQPPLLLLNRLLCGGETSRLYRRLVEEQPILGEVNGSTSESIDPGVNLIHGACAEGHTLEEARPYIHRELAALAQDGASASEMRRAVKRLEYEFYAAWKNNAARAEMLGQMETASGDFRNLFRLLPQLRQVSTAALCRAAARYYSPRREILVLARPLEKEPCR